MTVFHFHCMCSDVTRTNMQEVHGMHVQLSTNNQHAGMRWNRDRMSPYGGMLECGQSSV